MDFNCSIASDGEMIDFYSEVDLYSKLNQPKLLEDHLDFAVSQKYAQSEHKLYYYDCSLDDAAVTYYEKSVCVSYPWAKMNRGETLLYAAYPLLELQRQKKRWLTAYSAAVSLAGSGILLLGKSGAGKTSVTIDLCRRYGAKLIGNDLTVLGRPEDSLLLKGGTKFFLLRLTSIRKSLPDLVRLFPPTDSEPWSHKIKVAPSELGIDTMLGRVPIRKIFSLHIDEEQSGLYYAHDQKLATKLFLIENFSRYIRGSCINVLGGEKFDQLSYVPSYDSSELFVFRRALIDAILAEIIYISGPLKLVSDYIASISN
ncbi:MAG: hypothetical protein WC456_01950 [Patescibacteria group bacterium]